MNIAHLLVRSARAYPDRVAIRFGDTGITYAQVGDRTRRIAAGLSARGLTPGERVVIWQSNRPELLESLFACFTAGLVAVPVNARLHPEEVAYIVRHAGAAAVITSEEFDGPLLSVDIPAPILRISTAEDGAGGLPFEDLASFSNPSEAPVDVRPQDLAWLFYTSGTTGRPKGVMLTHRNVRIATINLLADVVPIKRDDIVVHAAPLTHGSGNVSLAAIARGATNVIYDGASFEPRAVARLVRRWDATMIAFLAPTQIVRLLRELNRADRDLASLRTVCYGGGPMYVEDVKEALRRFGPIWVQVFGQGESPMTISCLSSEDHARWAVDDERRLASAGLPRTDVEVRVVDNEDHDVVPGAVGEIVVRGDVVMAGYWSDPQASAEALRGGWLHTGDLGTFDELGYLYIVDRIKDMVVSGGQNIYAREVEEVLLRHPNVTEAAVIGIPDAYWGESVLALVVPRGSDVPSGPELIAFCKEHLASYKKPRVIEFVRELPKNAQGKVLKRDLRDRYWFGYKRRVGGGVHPDYRAQR